MSRIIALTNQKGGVGKTTSAVNIAVSLAVSEEKTLLIDLDPQANATTGVSSLINGEDVNTIYDVLIRGTSIKDAIINTQFSHLDVITSNSDLVGAEVELVSLMAREFHLQKALESLKRKYKFILKNVFKIFLEKCLKNIILRTFVSKVYCLHLIFI